MHGCESRKRFRRMLSLPSSVDSRGVVASVGDSVGVGGGSSLASSSVKDIRNINIGDCALFKPPEEAPPFIGIIRSSGSDKETNLQLGVTWLYRPADVQLLKGVPVEAAPNEVFYSFHRDEIPAASLLHPCKVAFLPKGVELPSGISSFVCRRVYDTKNKRLWWLTEKDFLNGRQEEVNQLLDKTQIEMHVTIQQQQGGRSPKPVNSPRSASQLKHSPDSVHNSSAFCTQLKGKKRECCDQGTEPVKHECSLKADDGDFNILRSEVLLKSEITKITEKGGLVDFGAVERLVQLMQQDKPDRKIDITCRSLLAGVVAATDEDNCLDQFVQLRGLSILDGWLKEVHQGKVSDSSSPRDDDKSVEDFLLSLLRALDRLPVNLNALQMCNIGKSVNLLRSHKNPDIQKKAKILVDTWKKRVEAEMNINDSRSTSQGVSWAAKTRHEGSQGGSKHTSTSKNFPSQLSSSKSAPAKVIQGEVIAKSVSAPAIGKLPSSPASTCANSREGLRKTSVISDISELPTPAVKDEKSSSSSQSLSNSHCSSDHVKSMSSSVKEDARCSNSGSTKLNKSSGSVSRRKKGANGLKGVAVSTVQREGESFKKSSLTGTSASEKAPQPSTSEKTCGVPVAENNNHKLKVKISNRNHSPALNVNGGPVEDHLLMNSGASTPAVPELVAQSDCSSKEKFNGYQNNVVSDMNTESWQSNDLKDGGIICDGGHGSPAAAPDSGCSAEEAGKLTDLAKAVSASQTELTSRKLHNSSLNSIDALIESCVKYSAANAPMSAGDVVGMNLLASVATGEMSKSSIASPSHSPQRSSSVAEESGRVYNVNSKPHGDVDVGVGEPNQLIAAGDVQGRKQNISSGAFVIPNEEQGGQLTSLGLCKLPSGDPCLKSREKSYESEALTSVSPATRAAGNEVADEVYESVAPAQYDIHVHTPHISQGVASCIGAEVKNGDGSLTVDNQLRAVKAGSTPSADVDLMNVVKNGQEGKAIIELLHPAVKATESLVKIEKAAVSCINNLLPGQFNDFKDDVEVGSGRLFNQLSNKVVKLGNDYFPPPKKQDESVLGSHAFDQNMNSSDVEIGNIVNPICATPQMDSISPAQDKELLSKSKDSKLPTRDADDLEESRPCLNDSSPAAGISGADGKLEFDLNEGFDADDCKDEDLPHMRSAQLSSNLPPFSVVSTFVSLPSSVTVAAAAKGPFVPPEDLLRNKGELGWKGSAATSAFRPAEPRKISEMPSGASNSRYCDFNNGKPSRACWEIDLNVADETSMEDMEGQSTDFQTMEGGGFGTNNRQIGVNPGRNSGGLYLDLNRADEAPDIGHPPPVGHRFALPFQQINMPSSGALFSSDSGRRDFDLNDGPTADDATVDVLSLNQHLRANFPSQPPVGFRINGPEMGGLNQWYPARTSLSAIPVPAPWEHPFAVAGTGGGPPRMLGGPGGAMPFNPDMYRGSVLSSSPAPPFTGSPYPYPVFPFGTSFPLSSSSLQGGSTAFMDLSSGGRLCVPAVPLQLAGSASNVPSQSPWPYMCSISDVGNNGAVDNTPKWGGQGLDLNAGSGGPGLEGRDDTLPILPRPSSTMGSPALTDEESRMYAMAGGIMKRKEPEGGWDSDRLSYKQPSWK